MVEGDPDVLPWERKARNIKRLVEMCKATDKIFFSSGIGLPLIVTFCAIGDRKIRVINGNEKGSLLQEIHHFKAEDEQSKLLPDSVFLDNSTGDFYVFDPLDSEWKPKGNVGLHFKKTIEVTEMPGSAFVQKPLQYFRRPDYFPKAPLQKVHDVNCRLFRHCVGHFLFQGIPKEFVVDAKNHWSCHQVQTTHVSVVGKHYDVLAESDKAETMILEHKNSVACMFRIDKNY